MTKENKKRLQEVIRILTEMTNTEDREASRGADILLDDVESTFPDEFDDDENEDD